MEILKNVSLKPYNTFGVDALAKQFAIIEDTANIADIILRAGEEHPLLLLGEGSNVLFVNDFEGLVLRNSLKGMEVLDKNETHCLLKVMAGENWSELVDYTVDQGWGGIENLSLIPGTVGAAPIQNIGAYGTELSETLQSVEAINLQSGNTEVFSNSACGFGYRTSIFKTTHKGRFLIIAITLKLSRKPALNLGYQPLKTVFEGRDPQKIGVKEVSEAVKAIRRSKLPEPAEIGNAGSFFKNPVVPVQMAEDLKSSNPGMPVFPAANEMAKIPAGWLIEQCGWKGKRKGDAGVHAKQALVLVNFGNATGQDILDLSETIREDVKTQFGISLEREVTVI